MTEPAVLVDRDGHVVTITLNRPNKRNAFNAEVLCRLCDAWDLVDDDPEIRAAILTGAGGNFSAGADLDRLVGAMISGKPAQDEFEERIRADFTLIYKGFLKTHRVAKPLIAAVEGYCYAGGMEILQAADIRVAGAGAQLAISEVQRGLFPMSGSTVRLPRQIPWTVAMDMLLLGDPISGRRAYEVGLVGHVVPDGETVKRARELADRLAANGPLAVQNIKASVLAAETLPELDAYKREEELGMAVMSSNDAKEGPKAFLEKRAQFHRHVMLPTIDLYDPDGYVDGPPHEVFEQLRREQPVYRQPMPDGTEYWAVLRHADVVHVARHPTVFSASLGGVVLEDLSEESLAMIRDMVLAMDPPRHVDYRRNLAPHFKARVIGGLEPRIRAICRTILDAVPRDADIDFVHEVCALLPSQVVGELVGIPREDWPKIHAWSEQNSGGQDPDITAGNEPDYSASIEMAMYAIALAERRRAEPQDDLATLILAADIDGRPMTEIEFGSFFVQLVTAGNDTTRTMLSSGLLALLQHPDQLAALRADHRLIPGAVEEILRWANPLHYFRRTASEDTIIGDQPIAAGEKVAMIYTSANRDETVFANPHDFNIGRDPNPHLSFGIAEHFCLGVHLARLEGRIFFEELLTTFDGIELTGEPRRQRSNLNNALKSLPVRLKAASSP